MLKIILWNKSITYNSICPDLEPCGIDVKMPSLGLLNITANAQVSWTRANRMCFLKRGNDGCQLVIKANLKFKSVSPSDGTTQFVYQKTNLFAIHCAVVLGVSGCIDLRFTSLMPRSGKGWERDNDDGGIGVFHCFYLQHQCPESCFVLQRQGTFLLERPLQAFANGTEVLFVRVQVNASDIGHLSPKFLPGRPSCEVKGTVRDRWLLHKFISLVGFTPCEDRLLRDFEINRDQEISVRMGHLGSFRTSSPLLHLLGDGVRK